MCASCFAVATLLSEYTWLDCIKQHRDVGIQGRLAPLQARVDVGAADQPDRARNGWVARIAWDHSPKAMPMRSATAAATTVAPKPGATATASANRGDIRAA